MSPSFKPALIESKTDFVVFGLRCQVWRREERIQHHYENYDLLKAALELGPGKGTVALVAELLARRQGVRKVEVTDPQGNGVTVYPEWP